MVGETGVLGSQEGTGVVRREQHKRALWCWNLQYGDCDVNLNPGQNCIEHK